MLRAKNVEADMSTESGLSIGLDVACAKGKLLPAAGIAWDKAGRIIVDLGAVSAAPPRGMGNEQLVKNPEIARQFAAETAQWLALVESELGKAITKVVIDAPRMPCVEGAVRRRCEVALSELGPSLSCFSTPTRVKLEEKRSEAIARLQNGGNAANIVAANLWWMEVGFALFEVHGRRWTCMESYPHAILVSMGYVGPHKSTAHRTQLTFFSKLESFPGWSFDTLKQSAYGAPSDRLDALMCAWIGSLKPEACKFLGEGDDCIVVWKGSDK